MYNGIAAVLVVCALAGCASSGSGEARQGQNRSVITAEELRTAPQTDALEMVQTLRPQWLRTRGPTSLSAASENPVQIYVDGTRLGGPDQLRAIPVPTIESLRILTPAEAGARFGFDHVNGAILVTTRRGPTPSRSL